MDFLIRLKSATSHAFSLKIYLVQGAVLYIMYGLSIKHHRFIRQIVFPSVSKESTGPHNTKLGLRIFFIFGSFPTQLKLREFHREIRAGMYEHRLWMHKIHFLYTQSATLRMGTELNGRCSTIFTFDQELRDWRILDSCSLSLLHKLFLKIPAASSKNMFWISCLRINSLIIGNKRMKETSFDGSKGMKSCCGIIGI